MRKTRSSGEPKLEAALADLAAALNATAVPWMVIGGIAVIAHGVRRMTTDIDAAVRGDQLDIASLLKALAKKRIVPRIRDAERFASESLALLLKHQPTGVEIDVSMAWTDFEHEALAACSVMKFGTANVPMAQAEDLIVFKAIAGRAKNVQDATTLLVLYPAPLPRSPPCEPARSAGRRSRAGKRPGRHDRGRRDRTAAPTRKAAAATRVAQARRQGIEARQAGIISGAGVAAVSQVLTAA